MKTTLTTWQIRDALYSDRENNGFTWEGCQAMAEWLEELEDDTGVEMELDVVAIRCDFSEWESLDQWAVEYWGSKVKALARFSWGESFVDDMDECDLEEWENLLREYIQDHGTLIEFDGGIIVQAF